MRIERLPFTAESVQAWTEPGGRHHNWPVVYALNDARAVYVGETLNAAGRMRQHLDNPEKRQLRSLRVVLDDTFNKSVCLDLESYLIRLFAGDGQYKVLNRNDGITDSDYYDRSRYRELFAEIFEQLRADELFAQSIEQIENSDLFKLSPFKALNHDQESAIVDILEGLFEDLENDAPNRVVIQGGPGTGKTIVAIYMMKLLQDIANTEPSDDASTDSVFADFFVEGHRELLEGFRVGLVVPQQSLRKSIKNVFKRVPGLSPAMVMSPFDVVKAERKFDLLVVDEAHRLAQYGAQPAPAVTKRFREINEGLALPGEDWMRLTQLDWVRRKSRQQLLFIDREQSIRPMDLPPAVVNEVCSRAARESRSYTLRSQMRVAAGGDYITYVKEVLSDHPPAQARAFSSYDLRFFDDLGAMRREIFERESEAGLARLLAGYGWKWRSKTEPDVPDIVLDGLELFWNRADTDWINSRTSLEEVGSIHTVQGYDLNYAGVIIGPELYWDRAARAIRLDRKQYADTKGKSNNTVLGVTTTDDDVVALVRNIYRVLLTRGMKGTYVYVVDPALREQMRPYFGG
ncbi:DNA/RNA helicase domain-containing protein [Demequina sp.]|uniref:DNA/RNA helicase domain-containing protein n=1 Tax=Demequina sp. TaxID=2050685 RepID=UPI0025BF20F3|nr:DNA/RNA helicase domain-containing protein [Demequina sp.]